jgi:hypothetical protein
VFDTTAYQHGYGWRAPQVNYGGPSPSMSNMQYAGTKTSKKPEVHIHMHGDVYGMKDFDKKVEKAVDKALPGGY